MWVHIELESNLWKKIEKDGEKKLNLFDICGHVL